MISISDNTAADMLIHLVGRSAVQAQGPAVVSPCRAERAVPDHPGSLPDEILRSGAGTAVPKPCPGQRTAFLASSVDPLPITQEQLQNLGTGLPTDIDTIEWFASPDDICRAFAGLQQLAAQSRLAPLGSILSATGGGTGLDPAQWPTVWYQGGSGPGVLTVGFPGHQQQGSDLRGGRDAERPGSSPVPVRHA
jgi:hypothetical protein